MSPFEVYNVYLALKMHFTQKNYDCFKYNWKTKASFSKFESRPDRYFFQKVSKMRDPKGFILANMLENPAWIGDLVNNEEAERVYKAWLQRQQSLSYVFKQDIKKLNSDFDINITVVNDQHPVILVMYMRGEISLETISIIVDMTECFNYWNKQMEGDPIWQNYSLRIRKYVPFLQYDKMKMRDLIIQEFAKENA